VHANSCHRASGRKGGTTTTMKISRRTELAHCTSDGIDAYLFWNKPTVASRSALSTHQATWVRARGGRAVRARRLNHPTPTRIYYRLGPRQLTSGAGHPSEGGHVTTTPDIAISSLRAGLKGEVIGSDDAGYDGARRVFFTGFDRRPAAIVRAVDAADV